jgi:hypothetical protein
MCPPRRIQRALWKKLQDCNSLLIMKNIRVHKERTPNKWEKNGKRQEGITFIQ